jgi:DNA polymerase III subunit chi
MERVDFYVLAGNDARERLKFACRIIDKAFSAELRVLVWSEDEAQLASVDDLLWTFAQDSFVPHEPLTAESNWEDSPVLLSGKALPSSPADVLINLGNALPPALDQVARIIEIIDGDDARRAAGRIRFKQYRDKGVEPTTHNLA